MERAIGTTFKVGDDELIVKEDEKDLCINEHGEECYFRKTCMETFKSPEIAGYCIRLLRKDKKSVIFTKK